MNKDDMYFIDVETDSLRASTICAKNNNNNNKRKINI